MRRMNAEEIAVYTEEPETIYWCSQCDHKRVNSKDLSTGQFFIAYGHGSKTNNNENYNNLIFAVCNECLADRYWYIKQ